MAGERRFDARAAEAGRAGSFETRARAARLADAQPPGAAGQSASALLREAPASTSAALRGREVDAPFQPVEVPRGKATPGKPLTRAVEFSYDFPPGIELRAVRLKGSWDAQGAYSPEWARSHVEMTESPKGSGHWVATVSLRDDGLAHPWEWGVDVQPTEGAPLRWGMASLSGLRFNPAEQTRVKHTPVTYHLNGARRVGEDDLSFRAWFPSPERVEVKVLADARRPEERIALTRDEEPGYWHALVPGGFSRLEGRPYVYELTTRRGEKLERVDMYAEEMQGKQRGIRRFHLRPTDEPGHQYMGKVDELLWFSVDRDFAEGNSEVYLRFKDASGEPVGAEQLRARLRQFDPARIDRARGGAFNDFWDRPGSVSEDGRIRMTNVGGAFSTLVNDPDGLVGLRYEFQTRDGRPLGDANGDGTLSPKERVVSANDPWDNLITERSGKDFRVGIIRDALPPPPRVEGRPTQVIYQLHPPSFMSSRQQVNRSTLKDLIDHLDYLKGLGVTDIQTTPPAEVHGHSWSYEGVSSLATNNSWGFVEGEGAARRWVSGREAYQRFVSEARARGLNVIADVVLNHLFEEYGHRWNHDGDPANIWFNRHPRPHEGQELFAVHDWGMAPNFRNPDVAQFMTNYVLYLVLHMGVTGLRFDFTKPIVDAGGAQMLQRMNSLLHALGVNMRIAEHFPCEYYVTLEPGAGGLGFTHGLYVGLNHELVNDNAEGVIAVIPQAAGVRAPPDAARPQPNLDTVMSILEKDLKGFARGWESAVNGVTTHDEVGNGVRALLAAMGFRRGARPNQWAMNAVRLMHAIGALSPGKYMLFQGEESLALNEFKWGVPSTWSDGRSWLEVGRDWDWANLRFDEGQRALYRRLLKLPDAALARSDAYLGLAPADRPVFDYLKSLPPSERAEQSYKISRKQTYLFVQDLLALRASIPELALGTGAGERVYTHLDDGVMAFRRPAAQGDVLVVANLGKADLQGYDLGEAARGTRGLPEGRWREVLNSDARKYGGGNFGNFGATLEGGERVNLPKGGVVVFQQVKE